MLSSLFPSVRSAALLCAAGLALASAPVFAAETYSETPGTDGNGHHVVGPDYHLDPDLSDRGNPKGRTFEFILRLADSKIFRGDDITLQPDKKPVRTERRISVYIPVAYVDGTAAPVLVIHDGPGPLNLVRHALDNLNPSKDPARKLPAFVAVADRKISIGASGSEIPKECMTWAWEQSC